MWKRFRNGRPRTLGEYGPGSLEKYGGVEDTDVFVTAPSRPPNITTTVRPEPSKLQQLRLSWPTVLPPSYPRLILFLYASIPVTDGFLWIFSTMGLQNLYFVSTESCFTRSSTGTLCIQCLYSRYTAPLAKTSRKTVNATKLGLVKTGLPMPCFTLGVSGVWTFFGPGVREGSYPRLRNKTRLRTKSVPLDQLWIGFIMNAWIMFLHSPMPNWENFNDVRSLPGKATTALARSRGTVSA